MRLGWFVALGASVALVAGGIVGAAVAQHQLREDRDERVGTLAAFTAAGVDSELARIAAVLETAPDGAAPASLAATLEGGVNVCTVGGLDTCAATEPLADTQLVEVSTEAAASTGRAAVAAGGGDVTDEVIAVAVVRPGGGFVAHVPARRLLSVEVARLPETSFGVPRMVRVDGATVEEGASSRDGRRLHALALPTPFVEGRYVVVASAAGGVTLSSAQRLLVSVLLALGAVGLLTSVGVLVAHQRRLSRRAVTDDLTGLATRGELVRRGQQAIGVARESGGSVAVVFVDLDGFKAVNDLDGHHVGDQVLAAVADRLRATVRDGDVIGRWGGDEFAVLLSGAGLDAATRRAGELCDSVAAVTAPSGLGVTASAGVAVYPLHGDEIDALVRAADKAMYAAKRRDGVGAVRVAGRV